MFDNNPYLSPFQPTTSIWDAPNGRSIYGSSRGYSIPFTPSFLSGLLGPQGDQVIQSMLPFMNSMMGGGNAMMRNPFAPSSYFNYSFNQQQTQQMMNVMRSRKDLVDIEAARLTSILRLAKVRDPEGSAKAVTEFANNPYAQMIMSMVGLDLSSIFPYTSYSYSTAKLMNQSFGRGGPMVDSDMIAEFSRAFAKGAGFRDNEFSDPVAAQGFSVNQQADIASRLAARGIISLDYTDALARSLTGSPADSALIGRVAGERASAAIREFLPAMSLVRDQLGVTDAGEAANLLQRITGGELGNISSTQLTARVAKLKELEDTAGIAVESLISIIDTAASLAESAGLNKSNAIDAALNSITAGKAGASLYSLSLQRSGGRVFGVDRDATSFQNTSLKQALSASGSLLATNVANIVGALSDRAAVTGQSIDVIAAGDSILEAAVRISRGEPAGGDRRLFNNQRDVATAFSGLTGVDQRTAMQLVADRAAAQSLLTQFPGITQGIQAMQLQERTDIISTRLRSSLGLQGATDEELNTLLNISAAYGYGRGDVTSFEAALNDNNLTKFLDGRSIDTFRAQLRVFSGGGRGGRTTQEALLDLYRNQITSELSSVDAASNITGRLTKLFGGLSATEGMFADIARARTGSEFFRALLGGGAQRSVLLGTLLERGDDDPGLFDEINRLLSSGTPQEKQAVARLLAGMATSDMDEMNSIIKQFKDGGIPAQDIIKTLRDKAEAKEKAEETKAKQEKDAKDKKEADEKAVSQATLKTSDNTEQILLAINQIVGLMHGPVAAIPRDPPAT